MTAKQSQRKSNKGGEIQSPMSKSAAKHHDGDAQASTIPTGQMPGKEIRMDPEEFEEALAESYSDGKQDGYSKGLTAAIQVIADTMAADNFTDPRATGRLESLLMSVTRKYQEDVL